MSILYITDQGASLVKKGNRLVIEKARNTIHWVHAFKIDQVILMGNISITPGALTYLLQEGIDTVFMSIYGRYRGRLISEFGKNIDLRCAQFRSVENSATKLALARSYVQGKLNNCRVLLRRYNRELHRTEITKAIHQIRVMTRKAGDSDSVESLMGMEGQAAAAYFGCFGRLIKNNDFVFEKRNRRPPRDPINVLLSLGYTLLANTIQTQVNIVGLDPYLGCLHGVEYGRPSLVLDLMEEFRPILVDPIVLTVVNKGVIRATDFYRPEDREPAAFDFAEEKQKEGDYPVLFTHVGMRKFITQFEGRLNQRVLYLPKGKRFTYRDICLEQVRLLARHFKGEDQYTPYLTR